MCVSVSGDIYAVITLIVRKKSDNRVSVLGKYCVGLKNIYDRERGVNKSGGRARESVRDEQADDRQMTDRKREKNGELIGREGKNEERYGSTLSRLRGKEATTKRSIVSWTCGSDKTDRPTVLVRLAGV